jgi:hypothetical protein
MRLLCEDFKKRTDRMQRFPRCSAVGFMLGIVDPFTDISDELAPFIQYGSQTGDDQANLEFYFAVGRQQTEIYFGPLANHPILFRRLFINDTLLEARRLELFLPASWPNTHDLAKAITLDREPVTAAHYIIESWDDLTARAQAAEIERVGGDESKANKLATPGPDDPVFDAICFV